MKTARRSSSRGWSSTAGAGNGTYLTMPSNCAGGQTTLLHLLGQGGIPPFEPVQSEAERLVHDRGRRVGLRTGSVQPDDQRGATGRIRRFAGSGLGRSPDPVRSQRAPIANSYLKTAKVVLPEGDEPQPGGRQRPAGLHRRAVRHGHERSDRMPGRLEDRHHRGADPVAAGGLAVRHRLPRRAAQPGSEHRRTVPDLHPRRLGAGTASTCAWKGRSFPNLSTGQVTAVVDDNPQATFSTFKVRLNGGPKGVLTSSADLRPAHDDHDADAVVRTGRTQHPTSSLSLAQDPKGGSCPKTLAERKFAPAYTSKSDTQPGQRLQPVPGPHRPRRRRAGAQGRRRDPAEGAGGQDRRHPVLPGRRDRGGGGEAPAPPSWPARAARRQARSATTITAAGSGTNPIEVAGKAYLAGPYKGAPLSMVVDHPGGRRAV